MDHPLLQLDKLVELGMRLGEHGIRYHNADASPGTNFEGAPETHKPKFTAAETLARIESASAWMALHYVEKDPIYRELVHDVLDAVKPRVERKDPHMHSYAGWIFITSPNAVTPYHMDHENNFILHVRGHKTLHVWEPLDRDVVTERSLELFHGKHSRDLVQYKEDLQPRAHVFELEPGMGGYMPSTAPHWVRNGANVSITISFTYYTDAILRTKLLYVANNKLRELGLRPQPIGKSRARDAMKLATMSTIKRTAEMVRKRPQWSPPGWVP